MEEVFENRIPIYTYGGFFISSGLCMYLLTCQQARIVKHCKYVMTMESANNFSKKKNLAYKRGGRQSLWFAVNACLCLRTSVFSKCFEIHEVLLSSTFPPPWIAEMAIIDIREAKGQFCFERKLCWRSGLYIPLTYISLGLGLISHKEFHSR